MLVVRATRVCYQYEDIRFEQGRWIGTHKRTGSDEALPDGAFELVSIEKDLEAWIKELVATGIENATGADSADAFPMVNDAWEQDDFLDA